eukprot:1283253-Pleurochrysis_carterae.AAC.1
MHARARERAPVYPRTRVHVSAYAYACSRAASRAVTLARSYARLSARARTGHGEQREGRQPAHGSQRCD